MKKYITIHAQLTNLKKTQIFSINKEKGFKNLNKNAEFTRKHCSNQLSFKMQRAVCFVFLFCFNFLSLPFKKFLIPYFYLSEINLL